MDFSYGSPAKWRSWFDNSPLRSMDLSTARTSPSIDVDSSSKADTTVCTGDDAILLGCAEENLPPVSLKAADVLTLTTFSRRAVIDFGDLQADRRKSLYLLIHNPHKTQQYLEVSRGLPPAEFSVIWIREGVNCINEVGNPSVQCQHESFSGSHIHVPGSGGRRLLQITWLSQVRNHLPPMQSADHQLPKRFHHSLQFRVNSAYNLQATIIGRIVPLRDKQQDSIRSNHGSSKWNLNQTVCIKTTSQKPGTSVHLPLWATKKPLSERQTFVTGRMVNNREQRASRPLSPATFRESVRSTSRSPSARATHRLRNSRSCDRHHSVPPAALSERAGDNCPSGSVFRRFASTSIATPSPTGRQPTACAFASPHKLSAGRPSRVVGSRTSINSTADYEQTVLQTGNLFHFNLASRAAADETSEIGLTKWLNSVFAPCIAANDITSSRAPRDGATSQNKQHVKQAIERYRLGEAHICLPGNALYMEAVARVDQLLTSSQVAGPGKRIEGEVDEGKIVPLSDVCLRADKGAQRRLQQLISGSYTSVWLHLAVDSLTKAITKQQKHSSNAGELPPATLQQKLRAYLFTMWVKPVTSLSTNSCNKTGEKALRPHNAVGNRLTAAEPKVVSRDLLHNRYSIKRFLLLVWLLDVMKGRRLVKYDPCLFQNKSQFKSSAELLLGFARSFLSGENNVVRRLAHLGARLQVAQTPLDEFNFEVSNLAVDLRDGVRLVKLAELLIPSVAAVVEKQTTADLDLMSSVRFPAISRTQKIYNVGLAFKSFGRYGPILMNDGSPISVRDVVDGHREKTLGLLWCLLLRYQVLGLIDNRLLGREIDHLRLRLGEKSWTPSVSPTEKSAHECSRSCRLPVHAQLLEWSAFVCRCYDYEVKNLEDSFSDGRALCFLLHHYLPTVLPKGLIRQPLPRVDENHYFSLDVTSRINLRLFQYRLNFLGDVPILLAGSSACTSLPAGLVLATLAYLASRLLLASSSESAAHQLQLLLRDHAARILQAAWLSRKQRQLRWISTTTAGDHFAATPSASMQVVRRTTDLVPLSNDRRKSLFGTPASPAMAQFFESYSHCPIRSKPDFHCRAGDLSAVPSSFESSAGRSIRAALEAVVIIQRAVRRYLLRQRRYIQVIVSLQALWRGYLARRHVTNLRRAAQIQHGNQAAARIQALWRGFVVRRQIALEDHAATRIQAWWRGVLARRRWHAKIQVIVSLQALWRGYLARRHVTNLRRAAQIQHGNQAAARIQALWRGFVVRRQIALEDHAATRIQAWWRGVLARRRWRAKIQAIRTIQRAWRRQTLRRLLTRRRISAVRIQTVWRGYITRHRLVCSAQLPADRKRDRNLQRIVGRIRLATEAALLVPDQRLSVRAQAAMQQLLSAKSASQVLKVIKCFELLTRLSRELCFWAVDGETSRHCTADCSPTVPLHSVLQRLIHTCNRSVPHEDILLGIVGILINLARHPHIAKRSDLWWQAGDVRLRSRLDSSAVERLTRCQSMTRLSLASQSSTLILEANRPGLLKGVSPQRKGPSSARRCHSFDRMMTSSCVLSTAYGGGTLGNQADSTSLAEALVGILLRTCRGRAGTPTVRLFSRACCLLSMLSEATSADNLPVVPLLRVCRQLSDSVARRFLGPGHYQAVISGPSGHSGALLQCILSAASPSENAGAPATAARLRSTLLSSLRQKNRHDLDWHYNLPNCAPDPLAAIDFLLTTLATKCSPDQLKSFISSQHLPTESCTLTVMSRP